MKKTHNIINNVFTMDVATIDCDIINKTHNYYTRLNNAVTMNSFTNLLLRKNDNNTMDDNDDDSYDTQSILSQVLYIDTSYNFNDLTTKDM